MSDYATLLIEEIFLSLLYSSFIIQSNSVCLELLIIITPQSLPSTTILTSREVFKSNEEIVGPYMYIMLN